METLCYADISSSPVRMVPLCFCSHIKRFLSSRVHAQGHDMGVQHGGVKWRDEQIKVCKHHGHGTVDDTVTTINVTFGLVGIASVVARDNQRAESQVELRAPANPGRGASGGRCHIRARQALLVYRKQQTESESEDLLVRTNRRPRCIPLEQHLLAGEGERL